MLPTYRQKMRNQTNMAVLWSILAVVHNLTNGMAHNAPHAAIARTTLGDRRRAPSLFICLSIEFMGRGRQVETLWSPS